MRPMWAPRTNLSGSEIGSTHLHRRRVVLQLRELNGLYMWVQAQKDARMMMDTHLNTYDTEHPRQALGLVNEPVIVWLNDDDSKEFEGVCIRADIEYPFVVMFRLKDGRVFTDEQCAYSPLVELCPGNSGRLACRFAKLEQLLQYLITKFRMRHIGARSRPIV